MTTDNPSIAMVRRADTGGKTMHDRLRPLFILLILILVSVAWAESDTDTTAKASEAKKQAELKWAKEVVADCFAACKNNDFHTAEALVATEYKKTLEKGFRSAHEYFAEAGRELESWAITSEEIAPDQDEAFFRGVLKREKGQAAFSIRVIKEKESQKWRISFFTRGEYKKDGDASKK